VLHEILCKLRLFAHSGEAETKPLADLATALGSEQCAFYGITEVAQSDAVFQNIRAVSSDILIFSADSTGKCSWSHLCCFRPCFDLVFTIENICLLNDRVMFSHSC
jgi:hypothetical protein